MAETQSSTNDPNIQFMITVRDEHNDILLRTEISGFPLRIGRAAQNQLVLRHKSVSGTHAEIRQEGDRVLMADLGSTNGLWVSGHRVEQVLLEDGLQVGLGSLTLDFEQLLDQGERTAIVSRSPVGWARTTLLSLAFVGVSGGLHYGLLALGSLEDNRLRAPAGSIVSGLLWLLTFAGFSSACAKLARGRFDFKRALWFACFGLWPLALANGAWANWLDPYLWQNAQGFIPSFIFISSIGLTVYWFAQFVFRRVPSWVPAAAAAGFMLLALYLTHQDLLFPDGEPKETATLSPVLYPISIGPIPLVHAIPGPSVEPELRSMMAETFAEGEKRAAEERSRQAKAGHSDLISPSSP